MFTDLLIAGAGPAGLTLAAAAASRGLRVTVIAPEPEAPWAPTYGAWVDEVPEDVAFDARWDGVEVRLGAQIQTLDRVYGRIDSAALQHRLSTGLHFETGRIVDWDGNHGIDETGRIHRAHLAFDATGAPAAGAYQTAVGWIAEADGLSAPRWMDFSTAFDDGEAAPTFLYALPLPDGTWLLEETALVRDPAVPHAVLEARLRQRLSQEGITVGPILRVERCTIPMDAPITPMKAPLRFGAAAGMVHPATGYLMPRLLGAAPRIADAVARHLGTAEAGARAYAALWPEDTLRRAHIHRYAARSLARLSAPETVSFLRTFFASHPDFVAGFLGDTLTASALVRGMTGLFTRLPSRLQWRLVAGGLPSELFHAAMAAPFQAEVHP